MIPCKTGPHLTKQIKPFRQAREREKEIEFCPFFSTWNAINEMKR